MASPAALAEAHARKDLTLYLGAGVSMASGLPSWNRLVLTMYLGALGDLDQNDNPLSGWRVFPNYLEAIAEWLLRGSTDPAEITAQKIRSMVSDDAPFVDLLTETLYAPIRDSGPRPNSTLDAVQRLGASGHVRSIVTYNYDDLLEKSSPKFEPVWETSEPASPDRVSVFHVHGFLPDAQEGSTYEDLILTEEQFHAAASDPYSWSNLVQMRELGSRVGLMVGMSLADRNLRRILEAIRKLPDPHPQFAILKRPEPELSEHSLDQIEELAERYGEHRKVAGKGRDQIRAIFGKLFEFDADMQERVLARLGVQVIWVDRYEQIPGVLDGLRT